MDKEWVYGNDIYTVDYLMEERGKENGEIEYLVKWKRYPKSKATWEPAKNIFDEKHIKKLHEDCFEQMATGATKHSCKLCREYLAEQRAKRPS